MSRRGLVALFVVLLAVQPAVAANYPSAQAACGQTGGGEVLVGVLPGSDDPNDAQVLTDQTSLYPGTTLKLALCKGGELKPTHGSEWSLDDSPGLDVIEETDATVTVRVTGAEPSVDLPGLVSGKESLDGVSITVPHSPTADSELAGEQLSFESQTDADDYETTERQYLDALANYSEATERLNDSAAALESGDGDPEAVTEEVLPALNDSRESVVDNEGQLEDRLYETAWESEDSNALAALSAAQEREEASKADERRAMNDYLATLESVERDAKTTVLLNLVGAAFAGLVVGVLPGWKLTASKLADIRFDRQVNSSVSYGPRVLARAGGLAAVALALTAVALVALGGLGKLGGLL